MHALNWFVLTSFLVTTAVYWSHSSHKSVIDALLFPYAAVAFVTLLERHRVIARVRAAWRGGTWSRGVR
jgi:hypothetical protein